MKRRRFLQLGGLAVASIPFGCGAQSGSETYGGSDLSGPLCTPTTGDAQGPFFLSGAPSRASLGPDGVTRTIHLTGQLVGEDCAQLAEGYRVDFWHADTGGNYHMDGDEAYTYRALLASDASGRFELETIRPGNYSIGRDYMRPAHYHLKVYRPDGSDVLTTQIYFDDDAYLAAGDGCQPPTCNSHDTARYLHLTAGDGGLQTAQFQLVI